MKLLNWKYILIAIVLLAVGFLVGRWNNDTISGVRYLKGEPIHDSIKVPEPYEVKVTANPVLPTRPDTVRLKGDSVYITQVVDTNRVFKEYSSEMFYKLPIFKNDTLGTLTVNETLQYNRVKHFDYSYDPIHKEVTVERKRVFSPFVTASFNSINGMGLGGGVYVKDVGASIKYTPNDKSYEVGFHYKF